MRRDETTTSVVGETETTSQLGKPIMIATSPTGVAIIGTLEMVPGTALITTDSFEKNAKGEITFDHDGETEIDWDGQETQTKNGKELFVDEDGGIWTEDQLVLKETDDDEG
jgi:hypothetical protein